MTTKSRLSEPVWYTDTMLRANRTRVTALLLAACFWLPGGQATSWYCEGRQCGMSLRFCCCTSPGGQRDPNCAGADQVSNPSGGGDWTAAACPAACNCVMISDATQDPALRTMEIGLRASLTAVLPVSALTVPLPSNAVIIHVETRGPPAASVTLNSASLRAPPIA